MSNDVELSIAVDGFAGSDITEGLSMRAELATNGEGLVVEIVATEGGAGGG